jgi:hypothetical protein
VSQVYYYRHTECPKCKATRYVSPPNIDTQRVVRLIKAKLWEAYPTEGAWETRCPYCGNRVGAGRVSHKEDCPLELIEILAKAMALPSPEPVDSASPSNAE